MSYSLEFKESALKEWRKLDTTLREQFKKRLAERLEHPHVDSARLAGFENCYKIKLRDAGYRLVYQVFDDKVLVVVIAVGKRERGRCTALTLPPLVGFLGKAKGCFSSAAEVDAFLRVERDAWER